MKSPYYVATVVNAYKKAVKEISDINNSDSTYQLVHEKKECDWPYGRVQKRKPRVVSQIEYFAQSTLPVGGGCNLAFGGEYDAVRQT